MTIEESLKSWLVAPLSVAEEVVESSTEYTPSLPYLESFRIHEGDPLLYQLSFIDDEIRDTGKY